MAMLDPFRAEFFRVPDIARFLGVSVATARKWFEEEGDVVRVPSGKQKDRLYIPESVLSARLRRMNIPETTIHLMVEEHQRHATNGAHAAESPPKRPPARAKKTAQPKRRSRARRGAA
jgi:hypothetical protein